MTDLYVSLIVIACTGVVVALVFGMAARHKHSRELALADYCREHGYAFHSIKEPLRAERRVEGDLFLLVSSMVSCRHDEGTGSTGWEKATRWAARGVQDVPAFMLGSVQVGSDWERVPDWMRQALITKLGGEVGIALETYGPPQMIRPDDKRAFLLFEHTPGVTRDILQRLLPLLSDWPSNELVITGDLEGVAIRVDDLFIQKTDELDRVLALGRALIG